MPVSEDVQRVIKLTVSEFAILAGVQYLLYAVEEAAPDYYV